MPTSISASNARNNFSDLLSRVLYQQEEFVIKRKGKPIAILAPQKSITRPSSQNTNLVTSLVNYSLGLKNWKEAKQIILDLHAPAS